MFSIERRLRQVFASCRPDTALTQAEETMRTAQIRRMPVTDERGALVGLISLNDIARAATTRNGRTTKSPGTTPENVLRTLAGIGERRIPRG